METIVRPLTWADFLGGARPRLEAFRAPGMGETMVLDENFLMEVSLRATVLTPLCEKDREIYRAPYATRESRRPLLEQPRTFPIEGEPADVTRRVQAYDDWLARTPEIPKLRLTFDGSPTFMIETALIAWCAANIASLEIEPCGPAGHMATEDQPTAIASAITRWATRHVLWADDTVAT